MTYKARDIATYIINYSNEMGYGVTNLKLQKLLYYVQAYFAVNKNEPCFNDDIERWRHGPVIREVYGKYKIYCTEDIFEKDESVDINSNDKNMIREVVNSYKAYDAWDMVTKTHAEEPWVNTEPNEVISFLKIQEYFQNNETKILGEIQ